MAHKEKFNRGQIGHMCGHYDRTKKDGENIDPELTQYNYNLAADDQPLPQLEKIHRRLAEVPHRERKDLNVMVSWIITAPKDLPKEERPLFFSSCYEFCRTRYGAENVISSYVHRDEPNAEDHMHYAFVPVTRDGRISAKDVITRQDLREFHGDLQSHLERALGHEVGVLNEATKEGNKSIAELKRMKATKDLEKAQKTIEEAERVKGSLEALNGEYEAKKAFISAADKASEVSMMYPEYVKIKKSIFKKQRDVVVPEEKWVAKHISANEKAALKAAEEALEARIQSFSQLAAADRLVALEDTVKQLRHNLQEVELENSRLQIDKEEIYKKVNRVLSYLPEREAKAFVEAWNRDGVQDPTREDL